MSGLPGHSPERQVLGVKGLCLHLKEAVLRWPGLELLSLVAAAPLLLFPGPWSPWAVAVLALLWLARWAASGRLWVRTPGDGPILGLLVMTAVGWRVSLDPAGSEAGLWRIVLGVLTYYGLVLGAQRQSARGWLPTGAVILGLALAALTLLGSDWSAVRLLSAPALYERLPRLLRDLQDGGAFHPRVMGLALAAWLPVPLSLWWFGSGRRLRLLAAACTGTMAVLLLLTQSLQGAVGLACALLLLGVYWSRRVLWVLPLGAVALALGIWLSGPSRIAALLLSPQHPLGIAAALRLDMWSRALAMIHDLPYTGIGLDSFALVQSRFYPGVIIGPEPHAHNLYLQVALDLGLPGLLAFLWMAGMLLAAGRRAAPKLEAGNDRALLVGAMAGLVSVLAAGLLDSAWTHKPSVLLWALAGLIATSCTASNASATRASVDPRARLRHLVPFAISLVLLIPGLALPPRSLQVNTAVSGAHRALMAAEAGSVNGALAPGSLAGQLTALRTAQPDNPHLPGLCGQLWAWAGDQQRALEAFRVRVAVDSVAPLERYAPYEAWLRSLTGKPPGDALGELAHVYAQWVTRYQVRAENYVLLALLRAEGQGSLAEARRVLSTGLAREAQPSDLLTYALQEIP